MTSEKLRQQFEGQLYKYTNVMKGWQYRWFILDPESGLLNYFLNDVEHKQRPRGFIHLAGAVVSPSDEDSNTFTVNSATGDMFKLRAADARSRQEWVNRMRAVAEMHTMAIAQSNPPLSPRESHGSSGATGTAAGGAGNVGMGATGVGHGLPSLAVLDAFTTVRQHIHRAEQSNFALARSIEELPASGLGSRSTDPDLLVMKATSQATLLCLGQCLFILQQQQVGPAPLSQGQPASQTLPTTHQALAKKNSAPASSQSQLSPSIQESQRGAGIGPALRSPPLFQMVDIIWRNIRRVEQSNSALARSIEELPVHGAGPLCIDPDLLVMKATSEATLRCLAQCLLMLQRQQLGPVGQTMSLTQQALAMMNSAPASSQGEGETEQDRGSQQSERKYHTVPTTWLPHP